MLRMLNPTFTQQQLTDRINDTEAALLLVVGELYGQLEDIIPQTKIKTVISYPAVNSLGLASQSANSCSPLVKDEKLACLYSVRPFVSVIPIQA